MISLPEISLMFLFVCGLFKSSVSLIPAKTIKGSQPAVRVLRGAMFQPSGFSARRSTSSKTAIYASSDTDDDISSMRAGVIKKELESYGISTVAFIEKSELVQALEKARADGLKPKASASTSSTSTEPTKKKKKRRDSSSSSSSSSSTEEEDSRPRQERLAEELEKCKAMKVGELKKELEGIGISTKSFFEKTDFVKSLADARVDGVGKKAEEGYAEYANVEVLTDDSSGPRPKRSEEKEEQQPQGGGSPFGGGASPFGGAGGGAGGGASPFGDMAGMGGMGGMGGIADMLKNMGGMGGGAAPGGGGGGGGGNPFGDMMGGMGGGDAMGKAQELMKNPKIMQLMMKAQGNPKIMAAMQECMSNPAAFAKYQNDPEVSELIKELQKVM